MNLEVDESLQLFRSHVCMQNLKLQQVSLALSLAQGLR